MIRLFKVLCFIMAAGLLATPLMAVDYSWNVSNGFVNAPANWLPNTGIPGGAASDNAFIDNGGIAQIDDGHLFGGPIQSLILGKGAGSTSGSVIQTGGEVTANAGFVVGSAAGSYGSYSISNGTLNLNGGATARVIGDNGMGVYTQTGGTVNLSAGYMVQGWHGKDSSTSVMSITGGNYNMNTAGNWTYGILVGWGSINGVLNIGGTADVNLAQGYAGGSSGFGSVLIGNGDTGYSSSGIFNLGSVGAGGGILRAGVVQGWGGRTSAVMNFHGGTLQSTVVGGYLSDLEHAYVYSEGAVFDIPTGNDFDVNSNLEAPAGKGISSIALDSGSHGSGYIGEPVVTISDATGSGASARAILNGSGGIDHIEITNPGTGYSDAPTFTIAGGGSSAVPPTWNPTTSVSVANNISGGLTKTGPGKLNLNVNCTYTGPTVVQNGTLSLNDINVATSGITVKSGGTLAGKYVNLTLPAYPATTVESGGAIAPGTPGQTFYISDILLNDGANLNFTFSPLGDAVDTITANSVTSAGGGPITVNVNYVNNPASPITPLMYGALDPNIIFTLSGGVPVLDSPDGVNAPSSLDASSGVELDLIKGGILTDTVPAWNALGGGNWTEDPKWSNDVAPIVNKHPDGGGDRGLFVKTLGAGLIPIDLNISPRLSSMIFASPTIDGGGESYKITPSTGTETITLDSGIAQNWHITVLSGTHEVAAGLKLGAGTGTAAGESVIRLANDSHLTLSGVISDETTASTGVNFDGNFITNGASLGILTLTNANTYSGPMLVNNGILEVGSIADTTIANSLGKSGVSPANFVLNNSTLRYLGSAAATTNRGVTLAGASVNLQLNGDLGISGHVVAIDAPTVTKSGAGTLTFDNPTNQANSFGGGLINAQGTINFSGGADSDYYFGFLHIGDTGGASAVNQSAGTVHTEGYILSGRPNAPGTYNLTGGTLDTQRFYNGYDGATGVLNISGTAVLNTQGFTMGYLASGAGYQSGGTVTLYGGGLGDGLSGDWGEMLGVIGDGYYKISGGSLNLANTLYARFCLGYSDTGSGIFEQTGGTVTANNSANFLIGMSGIGVGTGVMNLLGGTFTSNNSNWGRGFVLSEGNGILNIGGTAQVDMKGTGETTGYILGGGAGQQVVNIGGSSVVKAGFVKGWDSPVNAVINLHGGTIVAQESTDQSSGNNSNPASFMNDWTHAYIYPEGAKFLVEDGHSSVIDQVFEDATGKGLTDASVSVAAGGSGYIAPPLVTIAGGGGSGATAYATLDSSGHVNGIVISNPGVNYTSEPTITLSGGAGAGASIAVDASKFIDNTGGSFTKLGPGTLTLAGVSTYAGDTVVDAGTLDVTHGINTPAATVYVATGGTLNTPSIVADTLTIGGAPRTAAAAVPEPGTLALLALAVLGWGMAWHKRK